MARDWFAKKKAAWTPGHQKKNLSRLENQLFPILGSRPFSSLEPADFLSAIQKAESRGTIETAHRLAQLCGQVSRYARIVGHTRYDVAAGLAEALTPVQTNHYVTISDPAEIGHLLRAIDAYTGEPSICFALKILPFVFVRSIGLRGAEWGEFDFDAATWIIPAERMKMKRPHTVPLARQVIALLHTPHLDRKRTFPLSKPRQCQPPHFRHGATERTTPHGLMPRRYDNSRIQKRGLYPAQ